MAALKQKPQQKSIRKKKIILQQNSKKVFKMVKGRLKDGQALHICLGEAQRDLPKADKTGLKSASVPAMITALLHHTTEEKLYELFLSISECSFTQTEFSHEVASMALENIACTNEDSTSLGCSNMPIKDIIDNIIGKFGLLCYEWTDQPVVFGEIKELLSMLKNREEFLFPNGKQLIHFAVKYGLPDICELLVIEGINQVNSFIQSDEEKKCYSALGYAMKLGKIDIIKKLMVLGADLRNVHASQYNIWHVAAIHGHVESLLSCWYNNDIVVDEETTRTMIFSQVASGRTPYNIMCDEDLLYGNTNLSMWLTELTRPVDYCIANESMITWK